MAVFVRVVRIYTKYRALMQDRPHQQVGAAYQLSQRIRYSCADMVELRYNNASAGIKLGISFAQATTCNPASPSLRPLSSFELDQEKVTPTAHGWKRSTASLRDWGADGLVISTTVDTPGGVLQLVETRQLFHGGLFQAQVMVVDRHYHSISVQIISWRYGWVDASPQKLCSLLLQLLLSP